MSSLIYLKYDFGYEFGLLNPEIVQSERKVVQPEQHVSTGIKLQIPEFFDSSNLPSKSVQLQQRGHLE